VYNLGRNVLFVDGVNMGNYFQWGVAPHIHIIKLKSMAKQRHHRKCKSNGGTYAKRNISKVKPTEHQAFHILFSNGDTFRIADILNETWIDPDYKLVVIRR